MNANILPVKWMKSIEQLIQTANRTADNPEYLATGFSLELAGVIIDVRKLGAQACQRAINETYRITDETLCAFVIGDLIDGMLSPEQACRIVLHFLSVSKHPVHWSALCILTGKFLRNLAQEEVRQALQVVRKKGNTYVKEMVDHAMHSHGLRKSWFGLFG